MRKSTWILGLILLTGGMSLKAQQNFASLSFGATIPQGDYAKTGDLSANGYAVTGGAIKFDAGYFPVEYLGIGGSLSFGSNYANGDSLRADIISYIEDFQPGSSVPPEAEVKYRTGFWNYVNIFIGPHFSFRASQRLYFDFRVLGGVSIIRLPDQELNILYNGENFNSRTYGNSLALGFSAGAGMRIKLNSNLAVRMAVDYSQSKSNQTYDFGLFEGLIDDIPPLEASFPIQTIEVTAGLAYAF